jgi:eukaryotic-like serine/threonine-protein kinase
MIGKTLGHYRVGEQLGRGGMGEVYLADDLNLNRKVALKFLPDAFTGDPERMARFEREAKLLATLNHPNIAAIYGLEKAEGKRFLVLELVEGETLAQRLSQGPLPVEEALVVCRQIADGLEAAHEKGVIHRDLKPGNVMITAEEKVKILDFGLAKALAGESQTIDASQSPTLTDAMTQRGMILGTAAYMSPEQAKGKAVDKRADIWAFGCILFECLTGKRPFEGETITETLAAILKGEPNWQALPATIPPNIRFVLRRCLEKDVSRRFHDVADVRIALEEEAHAARPVSESTRARISLTIAATLIAISLLVGSGLTYLWHKSIGRSVTAAEPTATHIEAPTEAISAFHHGFALSPDGRTLIFSARTADGRRQLWKRRLDDPHSLPLAGTDDGKYPFWSPDGRQIAFYVPNELRRMPAEGGQVQTICNVAGGYGFASWGDNNEILFSVDQGSRKAIFRVPAQGGTPKPVPGLGDGDAIYPHWLPGSRFFLFGRSEADRSVHIFAVSIDGDMPPKSVAQFEAGFASLDAAFSFSPPAYLFFNRSGALSIQRFDTKSLSVVGQAVPIAGLAGTPGAWLTLSAVRDEVAMLSRWSSDDTGNPGDALARLKWLDRRGEIVGDLGPSGRYWTLRLSPDGLRAAANPDGDIWILEAGNRRTRMTSRPVDEFSPVWSPDGTKIAFACQTSGLPSLKVASPGGQETELLTSAPGIPMDWSRDGKYVLLYSPPTRESTSPDIYLYDFIEKSAKPWLATKFDEGQARFSPDGGWVAYSSNATGHREVYLRPFKGEGAAVLVSSAGGRHPVWRSDGRELFYLSPKDELMAVSVANLGAVPQVGEPRSLFKVAINDIADDFSPYDVTPDGQRFLVNSPEPPEPLLFIQGFQELLKRGQ